MPPVDAPALQELLARYERPLVRYASSLLSDVDGARDVVQETFIRFVRTGGPAPADDQGGTVSPRAVEAWLFTVCRNCAIDHARKTSRIIPMPTLTDDRPDEEPTPADRLESQEHSALLFRLLDRLPVNQREVIRLKFQNDLSYKEIAEVTQLSVTNVGFLLHTGLKKLRSLLQENPGDRWSSAAAATAQEA